MIEIIIDQQKYKVHPYVKDYIDSLEEEIQDLKIANGISNLVEAPVSPIFTEAEGSLLRTMVMEEFGKLQTKLYANETLGDIEQKNIKYDLELLKNIIIKTNK